MDTLTNPSLFLTLVNPNDESGVKIEHEKIQQGSNIIFLFRLGQQVVPLSK